MRAPARVDDIFRSKRIGAAPKLGVTATGDPLRSFVIRVDVCYPYMYCPGANYCNIPFEN